MDLNRTATFVRVVDQGGFTAAAKSLGVPKSSVSRAVALLEDQLGVRLLQRSTRQVRLTEAGSAFYERASRGIAGVEDAIAAVTDMQGTARGSIRLTAPVDAGVWLLEPALSRFAMAHPGVHVEIVLTGRVVDMVEEGFDLALRMGELRDASLIARKLGHTHLHLYASTEYLARKGAPEHVADLASHDCVLFRPSRGRSTWTLTGPAGDEAVEVSGRIGVDDFSFVRSAVLSGVGIGLLPSFVCTSALDRGGLVRVLPEHLVRSAPMHLVYPSARYVPHRVVLLRDFLVQALRTGHAALDEGSSSEVHRTHG